MKKPLEKQPSKTTPAPEGVVHLAGILVRLEPAHLETVAAALDCLQGVEVHHGDASAGKLVITMESPSRERADETLRGIQAMPGVYLAEPVYHYVHREGAGGDSNPTPGGCP